MSRNLRCGVYLVLTLCMVAFLTSCGNVGSAPISGLGAINGVSVQITPPSITVGTNSVTAFTATVNGSGVQAVQWQVNGITGGAAEIGTIDTSGNYTAPQFVPIPSNVMITAIANADNTQSGNASVNITGTLYPATVYMSPSGTAYVQVGTTMNLSAGITGPADTSVIWQVNGIQNGNDEVGTITPGANGNAVYLAPKSLPSPPNVTISAVSHAEPNRLTSVAVALSVNPPTIATVTISPVLAVVQGGTNFPFSASVIGASDGSVSWSVNNTPGGDANYGSVAGTGPDQGQYTAPFTIPKTGSLVSLEAFSNAQPNRIATSAVSISPAPPLGVTVTVTGADGVTVGSPSTYTASVTNSTNEAVTWEVNGIPGGNSNVGTIAPSEIFDQANYVAPQNVPVPATVVIDAVPAANPKIAGTLPVTISVPPVVVDVVCYPNPCAPGAKLGITQQQQYLSEVTGVNSSNSNWYVCTQNSNPSNCTLGGNTTLGTISPATGADLVTYTAPNSVPNPATVIIKAIPQEAPSAFGTTTLTISNQAISVQVQPPGPFQVPINDSAPPFTAYVIPSSQDQTVSWYVNGILNGNATVGTMVPDSQNIGEEDYIAPAQIPNPATVQVTAVPEADPNVVSNTVQITIVPPQPMIQVSPDPAIPLLPGGNETFTDSLQNIQNFVVNWTLSLPPSEGISCFNPNTPCGTIVPQQTENNNSQVVYTAPTTTGNGGPLPDPYYVNITATSNADPNLFVTVQVTITQSAQGSFNISPSQPMIQAGSPDPITFGLDNVINIPEDATVSWTMSCDSLAPNGENCGPAFGQYKDGGGPGCITYQGQPLKQCGSGGFNLDGTDTTFNYTAPKVLGPSYQQITQCNTQPGQTDGYVAITAEIDEENCPNGGICEQTVCIQISPPGPR